MCYLDILVSKYDHVQIYTSETSSERTAAAQGVSKHVDRPSFDTMVLHAEEIELTQIYQRLKAHTAPKSNS